MKNEPLPKTSRLTRLQKMDADLSLELATNSYYARLFRLLAEYFDGRSDAQIAAVAFENHECDSKAATAWLIEARRDIALALKLLVLNVALDAKEQESFKGGAK